MTIELKIPDAGESIEDVRIVEWLKQEGDTVKEDENVVELESEKASMTLPAPSTGTLIKVLKQNGESAAVGETIAHLEDSERKDKHAKKGKHAKGDNTETGNDETVDVETTNDTSARQPDHPESRQEVDAETDQSKQDKATSVVTPSARRELRKYGVSAENIESDDGRIRPEDVQEYVKNAKPDTDEDTPDAGKDNVTDDELTEIVPMSAIRRRIAERLVKSQQESAVVTTLNQINMSAVMELRQKYGEEFEDTYEVGLGYMSFFVKATVDALKQFPAINAELQGDNIVYRNYFHIGIAIGSARELVVPVLRYAERMSFAEIENAIRDFAQRADANQLEPRELMGGTFTLSNGGVYGSLLSTPIINPPQSGVVGIHVIEDRPVARDGQVVILPMMYIAFSYDHRIVDGRDAILFLKRIKEAIEEPARMLIEV